MSTTGSTFTDWQQLEEDRPLLIDDDFSWSDAPARRRRPAEAVAAPGPKPRSRARRSASGQMPVAAPREAAPSPEAGRSSLEAERSSLEAGRSSLEAGRSSLEAGRSSLEAGRSSLEAERSSLEAERSRSESGRYSAEAAIVASSRAPTLPGLDEVDGFDRDDAASYATARVLEDRSGALDLRNSGRRTVIITGRGDSRYTLAPARRRSSELRFHERSGFNPDRTAMWAVLLGIALLIGCIAH